MNPSTYGIILYGNILWAHLSLFRVEKKFQLNS